MRPVLNKAWEDDMRRRIADVKRADEESRQSLDLNLACRRINEHMAGTNRMDRDDIKVVELVMKHRLPVLKQIEHSGEIGISPAKAWQAALREIDQAGEPEAGA